MRPMTIEDFLKYVNAEAHYASGIFCFCEYSVDFITDRDSEDGSFHVHVTFSRYGVESEVDMEIDFVCGKVLLSEGALSEVQTAYMATRDAGADITEAALLTRQYLIATMHGKDRDTTEDDDG